MTPQIRVLVLLVLVVATGLGLAALPTAAWAHPRAAPPAPAFDEVAAPAPPADPVPAPALPDGPPLALALGLALAITVIVRRRALITALALAVVVLAVETGVHSVHHLADQPDAAECTVAVVTAQVHGTADAPPADHDLWIAVALGAVLLPALERPGARPLRPDEGRAPPSA